jgi:hypothetical protein
MDPYAEECERCGCENGHTYWCYRERLAALADAE